MVNILLNKIKQDPVMTVNIQLNTNQAEVVGQFTANSPAANSTGWSCLPIWFKREIFTLFTRTSKKTVTFAWNKVFPGVFQTRSAILNDEYLLRDIAIVEYLIVIFI